MRVLYWPVDRAVDVSGGAAELVALSLALAAGAGTVPATSSAEPDFGGTELVAVEVAATDGPGVRMTVDQDRRVLLVEGDRRALTDLAEEFRSTADLDDGGHQHIEHHPDHPYLAADSLALILNSPHGGMPGR
ncbi:hypothetical protein [Streptomyces sp. NPDC089919]|uniref:Imm32 family immunity protein n=1 Tax=Streptomyces sp. NPDC089919 TaxID=3155188 RepID=UPI0034468988